MAPKWKHPYTYQNEEKHVFEIGDSKLAIQRLENRWKIRHENPRSINLLKKDSIEQIYASKIPIVTFLPALPNYPIVLRSEKGVFLMPHERLELFVPVPVWFQIYGEKVKPTDIMFEFPSVHMSDTWFGEPQSGEKALSMYFKDSFFDKSQQSSLNITCPVEILNDSNQKLEFHRFALRTVHLKVFETSKGLVSNKTKIKFKGLDELSDVKYEDRNPEKNAVLLNSPRQEPTTKFLGKSFSFKGIQTLTGIA